MDFISRQNNIACWILLNENLNHFHESFCLGLSVLTMQILHDQHIKLNKTLSTLERKLGIYKKKVLLYWIKTKIFACWAILIFKKRKYLV